MSERNDPHSSIAPENRDRRREESPYEILGVDRDTDAAGIRSAFRSLARRCADEPERRRLERALEALTSPRERLVLDLFTPRESRLHEEIVRRYEAVTFELAPADAAPLLMLASDLESADPVEEFEVPPVPVVVFESMLPAPLRGDELVVPDRRK